MGESEESDQDNEQGLLCHLKTRVSANTPPFAVKLKLDGCLVDMEVNTGASLPLMSESTFNRIWPGRRLEPSRVQLQTYLKEPIPVVGRCRIQCPVLFSDTTTDSGWYRTLPAG